MRPLYKDSVGREWDVAKCLLDACSFPPGFLKKLVSNYYPKSKNAKTKTKTIT